MNSKAIPPKAAASSGDLARYALAILAIAAGIFAFYWFASQWAGPVRMLAVLAGLAIAAVLFLTTAKGAQLREFLAESRFELRKVVWPTREVALRTTWVVALVVVATSLILAGFDLMIQSAVKFLLGR